MSNENNVHYSKKVDTTREAETVDEMPQVRCPCGQNFRAYATVFVLVTINLLNYMDRFTIAGVLIKIQKYFNKENDNSITGLLQTSFICSYMIVAPIFGYLGDRLKRKYLMAGGVLVWSAVVFSSTLLSKDHFWWFLVLRGVVGIGEASYSTIAPTVIADLFTGDKRTRMLSIFYFAIPVGSGLGYVVGSEVAKVLGSWQAGLRVTPVLGVVCVILLLFVVHEPPRGAIERGVNPNIISASNVHHGSSYCQDLMYLFKVKSFIWLDIGFTCVTFVTGALAFWAPKFMYFASKVQGVNSSENAVSFKFGIITCVAGIVGVWLGAESARRWRVTRKNADPLVCAIGLISCTPFLYVSLLLASSHINIAYACVFLGEVLLCMNWAPVGDMLLYIIIPPRRSSAEAVQILMSHLFGDAGSPWLIGFIADTIRGDKTSPEARVKAFEYSFFITTFICVLGGLCFIICSFYIERDRDEADAFNQTDDTSSLLNSVPGGHHDDEDDDDDMIIANNESGSESPLAVPVTVPADEIEVHHDQNAPVA